MNLFNDKNGYLCKSESRSLARLKKAIRYDSCTDPGIFVRCVGAGGGVQVHLAYKKSSDNVFFYFIFLVLNLFYRSSAVTFKENYYLPRFQWGWNIFQGGPTFYRGSNCFSPIETHITCDFLGGQTPSGSAHVIPRIVVQSIYSFFLLFQYNLCEFICRKRRERSISSSAASSSSYKILRSVCTLGGVSHAVVTTEPITRYSIRKSRAPIN